MVVIALIKKLRDIMYNDGGVDTDEQRLREIVWLLFLKIFDCREEEWEITKTNYDLFYKIISDQTNNLIRKSNCQTYF